MRYLGIDYGSKRVGVAISDEAGEFALPLTVLANDEKLLLEIKKIIAEKRVGAVVLGESKNFKGEDNVIMKGAREFKISLEKETELPVFLESELFTSAEADRMKPSVFGQNRKTGVRLRRPETKNVMLDASAAALILKSYLDKQIKS
ncbi:MAG: Holliday junction resolvase RuvX [Candidatus Liptonbacteria bacterium]|nr:Holliday junction resolvase RuvX [Candidatus Liptonbacteria bacterium]